MISVFGPLDDLTAMQLGEWKIQTISDKQLCITLPEGMKIIGDDLPIDDLLSAISNYYAIKSGRKLYKNSGEIK